MDSVDLNFLRPQIESYWDVVLTCGDEKDKLNKQIHDLNVEIGKLKSARKNENSSCSACSQKLKECNNQLQTCQKDRDYYRDEMKSYQKKLKNCRDDLQCCEEKLRRCKNRSPQYIIQNVTQYVYQPVQYITRNVTKYVTQYVTRPVQYVCQPAYRAWNSCWNYCRRRCWWADKHMNICSLRYMKWISVKSLLVADRQSQSPSFLFENFIDQSVNLHKSFFPESWKGKSLKRRKVRLLILHCKQVDTCGVQRIWEAVKQFKSILQLIWEVYLCCHIANHVWLCKHYS